MRSSTRLPLVLIAAWLVLVLGTAGVHATDVPGSQDPPFLKRYAGSEIVKYETRSYDRYSLAGPDTANPNTPNNWKFGEIEGQIARVFYREPAGHSVLELMRNYQEALKAAGFTQTFELSHGINDQANFATQFYIQGRANFPEDPFHWSSLQTTGYVTAKGSRNGQGITVAVYFCAYSTPYDVQFIGAKDRTHFEPSQVAVVVDYVTAKALENKMIKAADMAEALATIGIVDLYGIYFDVDRTDIKPESAQTLQEVASLLEIDRALKLEISGHTDNTGSAAHNMTLSQGRANAVVQALMKTYGIDAARLQAKGYGDTKPVAANDTEPNRAKNRRVELRKL